LEADQPDPNRNEAGIFLSAGLRRNLEFAQFPELFIKDWKLLRRCLSLDGLRLASLRAVVDGKDFALAASIALVMERTDSGPFLEPPLF